MGDFWEKLEKLKKTKLNSNVDENLALDDFLGGFIPKKNTESAKKEPKMFSKNVSHSVLSGSCNWSD